MGNKDDCSPETWAAAAFGIVTSALEYAKKHVPEFVEELEKRQLAAAKRLVDLDHRTVGRSNGTPRCRRRASALLPEVDALPQVRTVSSSWRT